MLANTESALGLPTTVHMCEVRSKHAEMQKELERAEAEAKEKYELARKEMERKMQELKEKQELQLAELRQRVDKMKDSIFMLELNIFALRSLFGETFTLTQLRRGKTSNSPLVLYQKFKFLDEEFALLAVKEFGRFDGNHGTTTEIFKKQCVLDVFAPSEKCITFFRTSKDKKYFAYDSEIDGLKALEYYHENQVGMIIRNGENIWLSFIEKQDEWYELDREGKPYKTAEETGGEPIYYRKRIYGVPDTTNPNVVCEPKYTFYVSAKRHVEDWQRMDAYGNLPSRVNNVNLKLYNDEFCPVDFINSNYVVSWMEQKNIGDWYRGNYVYLVENVFHSLLKMLRGREERENTMIRIHIPTFSGTPDELDAVTEWKKTHVVRNFTEWQAKRFARWYMESGRCNNEK